MLMSGDLSLYIHIPFCTKKCPYCHFYVVANSEPLQEMLLTGLCVEWQRLRAQIEPYRIVSVYFGGGTPSLLTHKRLQTLTNLIRSEAQLSTDCEWTIEANPESCSAEDLSFYQSIGLNRISFGVQSFQDNLLHVLGRTHSSSKAKEAVHRAHKAGFDNITIDLMYELPHQTIDDWHTSLKEACSLPITHISLYNLTIEPHTGFARKKEELEKTLPSPEICRDMYEMAISELTNRGFDHYEISAFCKDNRYSRHNTGYWTGRPFLGLGPSAFSFFNNRRFQNTAHLVRWAHLLKDGKSPIDFVDEVSLEERKRELFAVGLRMLCGVEEGSVPDTCRDEVTKLIELGLLCHKKGRLHLTHKGILFHDTVASMLI